MSKFKVQQPAIHIPNFKEYQITGLLLKAKIESLGLEIPMGMLDWQYFHTDLEGWGKVLENLVFSSSLYKKDKRDCDWYAFKAFVECQARFGLNTLAMVIGDMPQGRHAFNMFYTGEGFLLFEPNDGFLFSGSAFEIGEFGYQPELILL